MAFPSIPAVYDPLPIAAEYRGLQRSPVSEHHVEGDRPRCCGVEPCRPEKR